MKKQFILLFAILFAINLYAQPSTITYQGVLTNDSGELITGTPAITFTLYDAVSDGNSLWTETYETVTVTNGLFQVELGSETPFGSLSFAQDMWLQITIDPTGANITLSPRVKFNASGYSLAGKATSLQITTGASEGKVLTSDASGNASWATPQWTTSGSDIYYNTGNVGIGTASPGHKFTVNGAGTGNTAVLGIDVTGTGSFNWASSSIAPNLAEGNNIIHMIGQSESLKNSGYIGFNYSGNSSNSNFLTFGLHSLDNIMNITGAGNVGIGTTAPAAQLHTTGTVRFAGAGTPGDGKVLTSDASGNATWQAASGGSANITTYGNVYHLATVLDATVIGGEDVVLSNNGPLGGITHTAGTSSVTVNSAGLYKVDYNISITVGIGAQLAVAVNGVVEPSSPISLLEATGQVSGSIILQLAGGDVLTLKNNSMVAMTLDLAPAVGAQMSIIKLN